MSGTKSTLTLRDGSLKEVDLRYHFLVSRNAPLKQLEKVVLRILLDGRRWEDGDGWTVRLFSREAVNGRDGTVLQCSFTTFEAFPKASSSEQSGIYISLDINSTRRA